MSAVKTEWRMAFRNMLTGMNTHDAKGVVERNKRIEKALRELLLGNGGLWLSFVSTEDEPEVDIEVPGVQFAYPRMNDKLTDLEFYTTTSTNPPWETKRIMAREPIPGDPAWIAVPRPGVSDTSVRGILVPGLGFDREFQRLGRGAGAYDRFLTGSNVLKVGVCFAEQLVDVVPTEEHDVNMDIIITDMEVLRKP